MSDTTCPHCTRGKNVDARVDCNQPTWHNPTREALERAAEASLERARSGIPGMGKDAPLAPDGLQSDSPYRFDLVDPKAMFEMSKVLSTGAKKYGEGNWRQLSVDDHINHAIAHLYAYLAGDESDDHLTNALCRAMFARAVTLT